MDIAFSPDGKLFASEGTCNGVQLWNTASRELARELHGGTTVGAVAFSSDGDTFAAGVSPLGRDEQVTLWDTKSWRVKRQLLRGDLGTNLDQLVFSPDGKVLAVVSFNLAVALFDVETLKRLNALDHAAGPRLAFAPDSKTIVVADTAGQIRLWNVRSGAALGKALSAKKGTQRYRV